MSGRKDGHGEDDGADWDLATQAIRAGIVRTPEGEHSEPIFATSSYVFASAAQAAARFSGEAPGNIYSRTSNPTVRVFEERLAILEGAEKCLATASGMAAVLSVCMGLLKAGDRVVASQSIFGPTLTLFQNILTRFGIQVTLIGLADLAAWTQALPGARLAFMETPSNPLTEVGDIAAVAKLARAEGALLVVDNSFCSPVLQRPLALGADLVVHSATKYIDGQGRTLGGAVVGSESLLMGDIFQFVRTAGPTLSPFNAWVFLKGVETLALRMEAHSERAETLARWLEADGRAARVYYPFLASHPQHTVARAQQSGGGGVLAFDIPGGRDAAWAFIDALKLVSVTANLGDAKTTITHPATTTHGRISAQARSAAGIGEGLVRVAVGLESTRDLKRDFERGFAAASQAAKSCVESKRKP